ncbi:PAS domain S-box-containing protein [Alkalihalobacillus xiaoxiensis]|uniref:PAS domain S-box-containing protein n=1 Tax=Shouchella xiaoxiensis TaxID=766895 RepID=A0ABS2SWX3_9BACI|nr:STAS domain-containing protein [Shouchella xiaoxiensis]MBM7840036.1 PAS domain S-box-containing protein [Shouchella xiaoxiensis]
MNQLFNKSQLLTKLLDLTKVGVLVTDPAQPDNPIVYSNSGFSLMTGYEESEVLGTNCRFLQGNETDKASIDTLREAIKNEQSVSIELLNYKKDGTPFWNELNIECVYLEKHNAKYFIGIQKDVTIQKEIELNYLDSMQRIETISTPIVPLVHGVAVIPLVGEMGRMRFDHMFEMVTKEMAQLDIVTLIVDVSGLEEFDEYVVEGIFRLRDILQLIGTETVVTGMSPTLAKQSVHLPGTSLSGIKTASSVKAFLGHYFAQTE